MKRLLMSISFLFTVLIANAQKSVQNEVDSLSIYAELFDKSVEEENNKEAIFYGLKLKEAWDKYHMVKDSSYCDLVFFISSLTYSDGNLGESILLLNEILPTMKYVYGENTIEYATYLDNLAQYNYDIGNYSEAIHYCTEAVNIKQNLLGKMHPDYATSIHNLAIYNSSLGNYSIAIRLGKDAMEIRKIVLGSEHPDYAATLFNLAADYSYIGNYSDAIKIGTEAVNIYGKTLGKEHPDYATSLSNLARFFFNFGNYSEAIKIETEAMKIREKALGTEHLDYASSLSGLSIYNLSLGNYSDAIKQCTMAMEIFKKNLGTGHPVYAASLNDLARCYFSIGNFAEALRLGTEAMEIYETKYGNKHPDYAMCLSNISSFNAMLGNYSEAIKYCYKAKDSFMSVLGTEHPYYALLLNNLASYYAYLGDYSEAIRFGTEAMEIRKRVLGTRHPDYALSLGNLASFSANMGNYSEAIRICSEALEVIKGAQGTKHLDYATFLDNLAGYHARLGNYADAIRLGTEALEIRKKLIGTDNPIYAASLNDLAQSYSYLGNYTESIRLCKDAMEIKKNVLDTMHPSYEMSLNNLADYYSYLGNYAEALPHFKQSLYISQANILRSFSELSSGLQESLWNNNYSYKFNSIFPSFVYSYQTDETVSELYDKTALFAKGILLNTGIAMRKLILESGDPAIIAKYDALSANVSIYDKQLEKPIKERFLNLDSLRSVIQQQEMELARESKAYGDYARNLRITWKDVQQRLDKDDIAIEFLDFPVDGTDSTMYVALTLRKGYDNPHMVTLFEKRQLKGISESIYYTSDRVYNLVWKPLEVELSGVKDIYFSPSGELHRIGIEYVPMTRTENIFDKYALHRLSSTRQLAFIQDETKGEKSVLYGGLEYEGKNGSTSSGTSAVKKTAEDRGLADLNHVNVDSLGLRGSYEYLPGTKEEGDQIASNLMKHSIPYLYYSGKTGTEESFKHLDGTKPKIMHIATHGFYLTERDAVRTEFFRPIQQEDRRAYYEDKPMTRSGLLLSGCYPALNHETIPEGVEDGILTAQEISKLDLRGLDLVVLSACQTGLGDITSGEGVFGLQRGFKQAGAKTIIMSLWKVSDSATRNLMTSFYGHYLSGMSKERAFHMAQDELRKQSTSNQRKPDWAAFVMLDGNI